MNKKKPTKFATTELSTEELLVRMAFLGNSTTENRFATVLKILSSSSDAQRLAQVALELQINSSKNKRGRPDPTVSEFERANGLALEVAYVKSQENLTAEEALRRVADKHGCELDPLRTRYNRNKKSLDKIAETFPPLTKKILKAISINPD